MKPSIELVTIGIFLILGAAVLTCGGSENAPTPTAPISPQTAATGVTTAVAVARLPFGDQDLYRAIWAGTTDEVRSLVAKVKGVNASNEDGDPFLYTAVWRAEPEKVQILVDAGADANAKDSRGNPLLHTAVWRQMPEAVRILIDAESDVDARDAENNLTFSWSQFFERC